MPAFAMRALVCGALFAASACATATPRPERASLSGQARDATSAREKRRELTWAEYYAGVTERARRRGALIMWITPPEVKRRPRAEAR